ncbi:MAG: hypothetical protein HUU50_10210 [Candidatus Brocadiae bacterium]|nr:hypothetical protein [Candidatus Brocadiia bacterium]
MSKEKKLWQKIRSIHFHPTKGSRFWIERAKSLSLDVFQEVNDIEDFWKLGELSLDTLRSVPPDDFLPYSFQGEKMPFESAGTSGEPVMTYFTPQEFEMGFVTPFLKAVKEGLFPSQGAWLYVGPSGPHAVGHAATLCSLATSGQRPFTVDFDPRWAKKLPEGSVSAQRYLQHICEQALAVSHKVNISILFITPPVLDELAKQWSPEFRHKIQGIQIAGMGVEESQWLSWKESFPHAQFLIGYGNSLAGVFYPCAKQKGYWINQGRLYVQLISLEGENRLQNILTAGHTGQVLLHRLDESMLYINLCERDQAVMLQEQDDIFLTNVAPVTTIRHIRKGLY